MLFILLVCSGKEGGSGLERNEARLLWVVVVVVVLVPRGPFI